MKRNLVKAEVVIARWTAPTYPPGGIEETIDAEYTKTIDKTTLTTKNAYGPVSGEPEETERTTKKATAGKKTLPFFTFPRKEDGKIYRPIQEEMCERSVKGCLKEASKEVGARGKGLTGAGMNRTRVTVKFKEMGSLHKIPDIQKMAGASKQARISFREQIDEIKAEITISSAAVDKKYLKEGLEYTRDYLDFGAKSRARITDLKWL